jgi:hypothetical protein
MSTQWEEPRVRGQKRERLLVIVWNNQLYSICYTTKASNDLRSCVRRSAVHARQINHFVGHNVGHLVPFAQLRKPMQFVTELSPPVKGENRAVCRCRPVERNGVSKGFSSSVYSLFVLAQLEGVPVRLSRWPRGDLPVRKRPVSS